MDSGYAAGSAGGDLRAIAFFGILMGMLLFGVIYNAVVTWVHRRRPNFPASVLVVGGTLVSIACAALVDMATGWGLVISDLVAFTATGLAMVIGDIWRATDQDERARHDHELADEAAQRAKYNIGMGRIMAEVYRYGDPKAAVAEGGPGSAEELD